MTGARIGLITIGLMSGAVAAAGCGGDEDDGGGATANAATTGVGGTTPTGTPTATTNGVTTTAVGGATNTSAVAGVGGATSTTGVGGATSTTGVGGTTTTTSAGGTSGAGGACEDESAPGGEAGAAGAPPMTDMGYTFVAPNEIDPWGVQSLEDCTSDEFATCNDAATLSWACGLMQVTVNWPAAANTASHKVIIENFSPETDLWDLSGRSVVASVRVTSGQVDNNGYDVDLGLNDFGDGSDWSYFSTCWSGDTPENCPAERHNIELWGSEGDLWTTITLPPDAAGTDFDSSGVRKLALQIGTKHWEDGTFNYDSAPVTFEVGMYAW